ncbi:MAG: hypothetical protein DMD63_04545 [Gemmatimonadetes bacterium]|nr:MAG: hypothetical protein DMD63_04545 [Gemmatimonadota bacterium]
MAMIAFALTDATTALVAIKLAQRSFVEALGMCSESVSPTAGTDAAETWAFRRIEKRESLNGAKRDFSVSPDRSKARTLLSIACCGVLAKGTSPSCRLYRDAAMSAAADVVAGARIRDHDDVVSGTASSGEIDPVGNVTRVEKSYIADRHGADITWRRGDASAITTAATGSRKYQR